MALIKCPECGKEISDKASACINCGFPLSKIENTKTIEETSGRAIVYCSLLNGKEEYTFDEGLDNGAEGNCFNENSYVYPYRVEKNRLYISIGAKATEYIIDGDFLVCLNGKYSASVPNESRFNVSFGSTEQFYSDGTYTSTFLGKTDKGTYIRENNILVCCGRDHKPLGYLIYNGHRYMASCIKKEKLDILKSVMLKFGVSIPQDNTVSHSRSTKFIVKCPYCQSENTKKISSTAKAVNIAMFGLFGNKRKYQWHCNNCNSDF